MSNHIIPGFSPANRYIFYASLMLCPAQALSGVDPRWPSNLAFLAYNAYQQYLWYRGVKSHNLHALSLVPIYQNMVSTITYAGGIPAGTKQVVVGQCIGVVTLIVFNTYTMWASWKTNLPDGYGVYKFSLAGERILSERWRLFTSLWVVFTTVEAVFMIGSVVWLSRRLVKEENSPARLPQEFKGDSWSEKALKWVFDRLLGWVDGWVRRVLWGATCIAILVAPFVYGIEEIVKLNHIVSDVDKVSIYLFGTQMVVMGIGGMLNAHKARKAMAVH